MASAAGTSWGITVITGLCSKAQPVVAVLKRKKRSDVKMNVKGKGGSKRHNYGPAPLAGYQLVGCWCATHTLWWSPRGSNFFSTRLPFSTKFVSLSFTENRIF